jgi:enhancing lycopene biosynthesis protein 2
MLKGTFWLKLCGHRRQSVPGDFNAQRGRGLCVLVVEHAELCCTTSSMVARLRAMAESKLLLGFFCIHVQQQLLECCEAMSDCFRCY